MSLGNLGGASVIVTANTSQYNAAIAALPSKFADAESKIRAQMARNQLAIKQMLASGAGGTAYSTLIQQQSQLQAKLQAVQLAAGKAAGAVASVAAAGQKAGGAGGAAGGVMGAKGKGAYRLQVIGQTLDDLQYVGEQGIRPILNNLMQISPILGIVALAIDQVARHWSFFTQGAERAKTPIEELQAKIKELEPKSKHSLIDLKNLDDAKKKLEELREEEEIIKRLRTARSGEETERGAGVERAVADSGGLDKVVAGLSAPVLAQMQKDGVIRKWKASVEATDKGFIDDITAATKGDDDARQRLIYAASNAAPGAAKDFGAAMKKQDSDNLNAAIADARSYVDQLKDSDARAVEDSDALNNEQFQAAKAKRRARAGELMGAGLTLDLLKHNAPASDAGRATVESGLKDKLAAAGFDKDKVESLAREMVDLTLRQIDKEVKDKIATGQSGNAVAARSSLGREAQNQVRDERRAQLQKEFGKAEVLSTEGYLTQIMAAGQSKFDDPAKVAVEEQKKANETLKTIARNTEPGRLSRARYGKKG